MFSITGLIITCLIYHTDYGVQSIDTQVVGGKNASEGQFPYQVSLKDNNGNHFCGGTIIHKKFIITAAHCLSGRDPNTVFIDVGSIYLNNSESRYLSHKLIIHPDYNKERLINDIGLINLTSEISFTSNTKLINLSSYNNNFPSDGKLIVTGWGRLTADGSMSNQLQYLVVYPFAQNKCSEIYTHLTDHHICTLNAVGQGMCFGDSGSALTYQGNLAGIVSYGKSPCAGGYPDVFTRVNYYKEWINETINAGTNQQLNIILGSFMTYLCISFM